MAPKIIELMPARRHKRIKLNIWGMTCTFKNSQPAKGMEGPSKAKEREEEKGWIDTHCLSHLGIQPTVIQVLSKHNWRMTHWEYIHWARRSGYSRSAEAFQHGGIRETLLCAKTNTTSRGRHTLNNDSFTSYTVALMSYSYSWSPSERYRKRLQRYEQYCEEMSLCAWVGVSKWLSQVHGCGWDEWLMCFRTKMTLGPVKVCCCHLLLPSLCLHQGRCLLSDLLYNFNIVEMVLFSFLNLSMLQRLRAIERYWCDIIRSPCRKAHHYTRIWILKAHCFGSQSV